MCGHNDQFISKVNGSPVDRRYLLISFAQSLERAPDDHPAGIKKSLCTFYPVWARKQLCGDETAVSDRHSFISYMVVRLILLDTESLV